MRRPRRRPEKPPKKPPWKEPGCCQPRAGIYSVQHKRQGTETGDVTDFGNAIAKFKKTLRENGSVGPATLFLICRVGSDNESARTLEALNDNTAINDIVLYSKSQLDLKLDESEKEGHVDGYIGWVVVELLRAMELQLIPP
ncbi:uncharacterized protein P884DRAFT_267948 [Thermothelomyces heterothallicus CBS 202.75]|uniref:uncharacterized protein n=1 Tax=Thermothelomyces heterothallicus CBS 202.75 TaxID=1149848 RepID=UPI003742A4EB